MQLLKQMEGVFDMVFNRRARYAAVQVSLLAALGTILSGCFEINEGDPASYENLSEWTDCMDRCSTRFFECIDQGNTQSACLLNVKAPCEKACGPMPLE